MKDEEEEEEFTQFNCLQFRLISVFNRFALNSPKSKSQSKRVNACFPPPYLLCHHCSSLIHDRHHAQQHHDGCVVLPPLFLCLVQICLHWLSFDWLQSFQSTCRRVFDWPAVGTIFSILLLILFTRFPLLLSTLLRLSIASSPFDGLSFANQFQLNPLHTNHLFTLIRFHSVT